jgi:hypothetical protein
MRANGHADGSSSTGYWSWGCGSRSWGPCSPARGRPTPCGACRSWPARQPAWYSWICRPTRTIRMARQVRRARSGPAIVRCAPPHPFLRWLPRPARPCRSRLGSSLWQGSTKLPVLSGSRTPGHGRLCVVLRLVRAETLIFCRRAVPRQKAPLLGAASRQSLRSVGAMYWRRAAPQDTHQDKKRP